MESQEASGAPNQDKESGRGSGGRKEGEGGQMSGPPTQVSQEETLAAVKCMNDGEFGSSQWILSIFNASMCGIFLC